MPKARLVTDGTAVGTHVYDQDGKEILGWSKLTLQINPRGVTRAYIEMQAVEAEATGIEISIRNEPGA